MSISSMTPIIYDIETIPAEGLVFEDTKNAFPPPIYHKPIVASFAVLNPTSKGYVFQKLKTICSEPKILKTFARVTEKTLPRYVGWNNHNFDSAVIMNRSFATGVPQKAWFGRGTKWECYPNRYSDWNLDLCDEMSSYGASRKLKLDVVAASIGLPGKAMGMDGSLVAQYFADGRLPEICNYCETDTLNTTGVFLRWELTKGKISPEQYAFSIESFLSFLEQEGQKDDASHLHKFRDLIDLSKFAVEELPTTQSLVRKAVTNG